MCEHARSFNNVRTGALGIMSLLREAVAALRKYFYKPIPPRGSANAPERLIKEFPDMSVAELLRIYAKDKHTYHDARTTAKLPPASHVAWAKVINGPRVRTVVLGPFHAAYTGTGAEKKYVAAVQRGIAFDEKKHLVIDLRRNIGGSDVVMLKALKGVEKWPKARVTVRVGPLTASAGEMVAATLVHDYGFARAGPRTAGMMTECKNLILSDGSFLNVATGLYTTPGGHACKRTYL